MFKNKWLVAGLTAMTLFPLAIVACGSDAPVRQQPEEGTCYNSDGTPCTGDGGVGGDTNNDGGNDGGSTKPPVDSGAGGDTNTGGSDSGAGGDTNTGGSDSGAGGDTGTGGDSGTGGGDGGSDSGCPGLQVQCGGVCKDLAWDFSNCGSCGHVCSGGTTCQAGECLPCPVGTWNCGTSCVDFKTDEANCGGCKVTCDPGETCHAQSGPPWGLCY
jgi:hypothetical protein